MRIQSRLHYLLLALCLISFSSLGWAQGALSGSMLELQRSFQNTAQQMNKPEFVTEIAKIPRKNRAELIGRFAPFKQHQQDASRIDHRRAPGAAAEESYKLTKNLAAALSQVLHPLARRVPGHNAKEVLLSKLPSDQAWTVLSVLDNDRKFVLASSLAQAMMEREADKRSRDLLALVAARSLWLDSVTARGEYAKLINQALQSSDNNVAAQARLWHEATTHPASAEALILCHQIWETAHLDLNQRGLSGYLSILICRTGKGVFEKVKQQSLEPVAKDELLGQLATIISEAAYQLWRPDLIHWAVKAAEPLSHASAEDKLMPQYYVALESYSKNAYDVAAKSFEKVFCSGVDCDAAADAGLRMADCQVLSRDKVGAVATLEMLNKHYSTRKSVMPRANMMLDKLRKEIGDDDAAKVNQYIAKSYKPKFEHNQTGKQ